MVESKPKPTKKPVTNAKAPAKPVPKKVTGAAPVKGKTTATAKAPAKKAPEKKIEKQMEQLKVEDTGHFAKLQEMIEEHAHEDIKKCFTEFLTPGNRVFGAEPEDYNEKLEGREFKEWMHI